MTAAPSSPPQHFAAPRRGTQPLSQRELQRLTLYKWRYSLEACGFVEREVQPLLFLKWLHATRRLQP